MSQPITQVWRQSVIPQESQQASEWGDDEAYPASEPWDDEDSIEYDVVKPDPFDCLGGFEPTKLITNVDAPKHEEGDSCKSEWMDDRSKHVMASEGEACLRDFVEPWSERLEHIIQQQASLAMREPIQSPWMAHGERPSIASEDAWLALEWGDDEAYPASEPWDGEDSTVDDAVKPDQFASLDCFVSAPSVCDDALRLDGGETSRSQSTDVTDKSDESDPALDTTLPQHSNYGVISGAELCPRDFDEASTERLQDAVHIQESFAGPHAMRPTWMAQACRQPLHAQEALQSFESGDDGNSRSLEFLDNTDKAEHDIEKPNLFPTLEDQFGISAIGA